MSKQQEVVINVIESELSKFKIGWFSAYDTLKGMVALYGADKVQEALTEIIGDGNARMEHYFITQPDVVFPENWFCAKCGEYFTHPNHIHSRDCLCKTCEQKRLLTMRAADGAVCDLDHDMLALEGHSTCPNCGAIPPRRQPVKQTVGRTRSTRRSHAR